MSTSRTNHPFSPGARLLRPLLALTLLALATASLAQAPQRLVDYAAGVGVHPDDARIPNEGAPRFGGVVNYAENETIATLDSHRSAARVATLVNTVFAEGLFAFDAVGDPAPQLVDRYTVSDDGTVYTFHLRQGVPFHDGEELLAGDVIASLTRWFGGTLGRQAAERVTGLRAADAHTVEVTLSEPYGFLVYQLSVPQTSGAYIYPASQIEAAGDADLPLPLGTGPYTVVEHREGQYVRFARFDDYVGRNEAPSGFAGGKVAYLDEIVIHEITDAAVRVAGVETGQYQVVRQATTDLYPLYANRSDIRPRIDNGNYSTANFNKCQGLMTDLRLRRAFSLAIDVSKVVAASGPAEFNRLNPSMAPEGDPWHTTMGEEQYLAYDPAAARALLAEAGYEGQPVRWLVDPNVPSYYTAALVSKPMLEEVGFNVEIMPMDAATLRTLRNDPLRHEVYAQALSWRPDPAALTNLSDGNPGCWVTDEKTRLLTGLRTTPDFETRYGLWEDLQAHFYDYVPAVKFETYGTLDLERADYSGHFKAWGYYNFVNTWLN